VTGFKQLNIDAASPSARKNLDLTFVMDASGSLSSRGANVKSSAICFLEKFSPTTDRVALIHFAYGAVVDDPIRTVGRGFNLSSMNAPSLTALHRSIVPAFGPPYFFRRLAKCEPCLGKLGRGDGNQIAQRGHLCIHRRTGPGIASTMDYRMTHRCNKTESCPQFAWTILWITASNVT
jgi:hypothetical protein